MEQNINGHRENSQRHQSTTTQNQNTGMSFLLKKGEKLTTALYMVTDIMSEKEPMKWKIRENGVELLSDIAVSYGASASERMSVMSNAIKKIDKIVSFLEITERARMISEMNASVLKKEYLALKDAVEKEWNNIYDKSKSIFSASFFEVPREPMRELKSAEAETSPTPQSAYSPKEPRPIELQASSPHSTNQPKPGVQFSPNANVRTLHQGQAESSIQPRASVQGEHKGEQASEQIRVEESRPHSQPQTSRLESSQESFTTDTRQANEFARGVHHGESQRQTQAQPNTQPKTQPQTLRTALRDVLPTRTQGEGGSSERRTIILAKIKDKPSVNVRDLADSIPHVSEKTIQRELLAMVSEGILLKKGERRWSTYSLR